MNVEFNALNYLLRYKSKVSPLKPIRMASNGITSLGAMLPRFTLQPNN